MGKTFCDSGDNFESEIIDKQTRSEWMHTAFMVNLMDDQFPRVGNQRMQLCKRAGRILMLERIIRI